MNRLPSPIDPYRPRFLRGVLVGWCCYWLASRTANALRTYRQRLVRRSRLPRAVLPHHARGGQAADGFRPERAGVC